MLLERARQRLHASITDLVLAHDEPKFARRGWSQWTPLGTGDILLQGQARQHRGTEAAADENLDRLHVPNSMIGLGVRPASRNQASMIPRVSPPVS